MEKTRYFYVYLTLLLKLSNCVNGLLKLSISVNGHDEGVRCGKVVLKDVFTAVDLQQENTQDEFGCVDCLFPHNCLRNNTCRLGTTGSMCEQCLSNTNGEPGYYRMGSVCTPCPEVPYWTAICFVVFILIFLGCFMFHGLSDSMCTKVKLLIHFLQFLVLSTHIKLAWPDILLRAVSTLNFGVFNSNIILPGCVFKRFSRMTNHYLEWYSSLCVPLLTLALGLMVDRRFKVLIGRPSKITEDASEKRMKKMDRRLKARRFCCLVILAMYMPALVASMRTFQCSGTIMKDLMLDRSKDVFLLDTDYTCKAIMFQMTHFIAVLYIVALILFTIWILIFTLRQKKWDLLDKEWILHGPIYECYKNKYCFWEVIPLLRKLVCVLITESHPLKPLWQAILQLGMTTLYILCLIILRPYRSCFWAFPKLNNHTLFEVLSNLSVLMLQGVGLSVIMGRFKEGYSYIVILGIATVLVVWVVLMFAMRYEIETDTRLTEMPISQAENQGDNQTNRHPTESCLRCCKKNRIEPDIDLENDIEERKQRLDF